MKCQYCQKITSTKTTEDHITILCKCRITIIYPDHRTTTIHKNEYEPRK